MTRFLSGTRQFFHRKNNWHSARRYARVGVLGIVLGLLTYMMVTTALSTAAPLLADMRIQNAVNLLRQERLTVQRHQAMSELENDGERAVPALITALHSDDPVLRRNAADILSYIVTPQALAALQPGQ